MNFAKETNADLVIAALPVNKEDAKRMGIMKVYPDYSVAYADLIEDEFFIDSRFLF